MILNAVRNNITDLIALLRQLSDTQFTTQIPELSEATIGEHTRHIIEMFQSLLGRTNGEVNYDDRRRDFALQGSIDLAVLRLNEICAQLPTSDQSLTLVQCIDGQEYRIASNVNRELLYNLEHAIHHQALIKVALRNFSDIAVGADFGVAKSTIDYRNRCAQ